MLLTDANGNPLTVTAGRLPLQLSDFRILDAGQGDVAAIVDLTVTNPNSSRSAMPIDYRGTGQAVILPGEGTTVGFCPSFGVCMGPIDAGGYRDLR